ncbi:hypothetical protein SAMN04488490_0271 [Marinobacter sp. LV10R510-11A]|uniref:hypothetical protein n=1 Tax=Marinobacter sp. LV10R510-11A TaxID=1415568 RepID=UPI000BB69ABE|nr:hypothetical protein [Marinobacter sp. LV10R510-11A]SOB74744.1 hypothetical protein SAMN04488490_0271 [Marinobacter sp. LV10R510-11A]
MKIKVLCVGLLLSSAAMANDPGQNPKSISVLNFSEGAVDLWVNGEYRELRSGIAMLQPCLVGEQVEIQVGMELTHIECGETKEIEK